MWQSCSGADEFRPRGWSIRRPHPIPTFDKLTAEAQNVAGFEANGLGATGMYLIGALELAGAIAMFIPRLTGLAALCFVALMVGAVTITWAMVGASVLVSIPATVGVLAAVVAWGRRDSTRRLIAQLLR